MNLTNKSNLTNTKQEDNKSIKTPETATMSTGGADIARFVPENTTSEHTQPDQYKGMDIAEF